MNRAKHLTSLIFKILFIVLCFLGASVVTVFQNIPLNKFEDMKGKTGLENCEILVLDTSFKENGAKLDYEIKDGKILFDITQSGERYDDITVVITYPEFKYDNTAMRNYLHETLGEDAEDEEEYLSAMENGPWRCNYTFSLTGETKDGKSTYTFLDPDDVEYVKSVESDENAEGTTITDFYVQKDEKLSFMLTFGGKSGGALPSGKYTFASEMGVNGLYDGDVKISAFSTIKILGKICSETVKEKGLNIFSVENWLVFYGAMIVLGMFIYLWRDIRSLAKIFLAMMEERYPPVRVIVKVYVNGFCTEEYSYMDDGTSLIAALIVTLLCYVFFLLTYPIRILIQLIWDIVNFVRDDDEIEGFSYLGNIMGSVGIYVLLFGVVALMSANTVAGIIGLVLGLGMCVGARFICKRREEEYG